MLLRQLKFPIAIVTKTSIAGGYSAGLHNAGKFNFDVEDRYLNSYLNGARIIDSLGREFSIKKIFLRKPSIWRRFLDRADGFFVFPSSDDPATLVSVEMELKLERSLSLSQFCAELKSIALDHPIWWQRHSDQDEIESMFDGCGTFKDAINDIGVLDPPGPEKLPGKSSVEIIDLR